MRQATLLLAKEGGGLPAVAFVDQRLDWLYLVFLRPKPTHRLPIYEVEFAVELPESPATTALVQRMAASAGIHATD
jgi:hypothetical protein